MEKWQEVLLDMEKQRDLYRDLYDQQHRFIDVLISALRSVHVPTLMIEDGELRQCRPGEVIKISKGKKK